MSAEQVALIPQCAGCGEVWLAGERDRWCGYVVDDGSDDQLVFYCADCAKREFGS